MCMLSFIPAGVKPDEEGLLNGGILNGDGHGWAIVTDDDRLLMGKSMRIEAALDEFMEARDKHMEGPALFHSRWATHGSTSLANVHPFLVGGSHQTVVAHNGILPCRPKKGDDRSDTRLFADKILATQYRKLDRVRTFNSLQNWIGMGNKLVILTVDPRYRSYSYIVNENAGHWDSFSGNWHSNYDYLGYSKVVGYSNSGKPQTSTKTTGQAWVPTEHGWQNYADPCAYCNGYVSATSGYCTECGTCADCLEVKSDCQCWANTFGGQS